MRREDQDQDQHLYDVNDVNDFESSSSSIEKGGGGGGGGKKSGGGGGGGPYKLVSGPSSLEYAEWPKFTHLEVKRHDRLNDGWIIIHSRVYDITSFAKTHPGFNNAGQVSTALAIARSLGKDATEEFTEIHSTTAWKQLKDFQIGVVCRPGDEETLAEKEAPKEHVIPKWLSDERDFWVRYSGGVDAAVLRYLTKNGYPQGEGRHRGDDEDDDEATPRVDDETRERDATKRGAKRNTSKMVKFILAFVVTLGSSTLAVQCNASNREDWVWEGNTLMLKSSSSRRGRRRA